VKKKPEKKKREIFGTGVVQVFRICPRLRYENAWFRFTELVMRASIVVEIGIIKIHGSYDFVLMMA